MPSDKCPKELGNAENIISKTTQEKFRVIKKLEKFSVNSKIRLDYLQGLELK